MKLFQYSEGLKATAIGLLKNGGIIAHPADTCFGLAGDLMKEKALKKLQAIKGRDAQKPMSIMLPVYMKLQLSDYVKLNDFSAMVCERLLPGPVTIVLPKGPKIPKYFFPDTPDVGIRIPYDAAVEDLLTRFHGPLITTSANMSGEQVCCSHEEVLKVFKEQENQPDLVLEGKISNNCLPSTIIKVEGKKIHILREGPMKKEELEGILRVPVS